MHWTRKIVLGCAAACIAAGGVQAQSGGSAPAEGLSEGQGAGFAKGHYAELDALPDWGGVWFLNRGGPTAQPKLKGKYQTDWEAWRADVSANDGVEKRNRSNCAPPGMPRIMQLAQYPYEFIFSPGRVTINQEAWMQTRTIWTDGREHPPLEELDPTYMGHSVGHWEGDTLVVDTIGVLDMLPFANGALHSEKFRITERIHLDPAKPDTLVNEMVMEDPDALAEPFKATVTYRRDRYGVLYEFQCSENNRNPVNLDGETEFE